MKQYAEAIVRGVDSTKEAFETSIEFALIEPDKDEIYYGTGCYLKAKTKHNTHLVDVRYTGAKDIYSLAKIG